MQAEHAHTRLGDGSARLGGARADFVAGLGRKVADLRATLARVRGDGAALAARDELRRKLHALGSASKMMKFDAMDRAIAEALGRIDAASREAPLDAVDLDALEQTIDDMPALAWGDGTARSSRAEAAEKAERPAHSVLVVGAALIAEALLENDEGETRAPFACECTPDAQAAFDLVRKSEPDLVVLDADLPAASELVEALMDDPLTEAVPIVVVGSFLEAGEGARYIAMGVTKTVAKPTSREALRAICKETLAPPRAITSAHAVLGEPTVTELGDRLAAEIREALVGKVDPAARGKRVPLGEGTEVLGALWGAIARVREVVTARTDGAVRFAGGPEGALTLAPPLHDPDVARADRIRGRARSVAADVQLRGRRVVVADDDPGVVWFMADLLKTAGCTVHEAFDGQQALDLSYEHSPDLVISDILMPNVDGFSLCRALRRDVALRDTPVILLSWKEDLLQRVRELGADAAGYVRKESDTRAILARVREALRPRARIEARLKDEGEVRGRLDGVTVRTLLEIVCATRPEARVAIRDASFLYEVEIRLGAPHRATRTAGDGSFMRGTKVLAAMLGVSAGRFTVTTTTSPVDQDLDGNLSAQLAKPIARARAATMLLTGAQMTWVTKVVLDEAALSDYLRATPERARVVARRLANGAAPRALVLDGLCEASLLDDLLADLAAHGVVTEVQGAGGEDLLGPTTTRLYLHTDARAALAPRTATPSPVPALADALPTPAVACEDDTAAPLCESPLPGSAGSLEEAVLREVALRSPSPEPLAPIEAAFDESPRIEAAFDESPRIAAPMVETPIADALERHAARFARSFDDEGTPPAEQIVALSEATVVDGATYGAMDDEAPIEEASRTNRADETEAKVDVSIPIPAAELEPTPFSTVTTDEHYAPQRKKRWPMVAFVAATGIVTWAVLHFSLNEASAPKQLESSPPPSVENVLPPPASDKAPPSDVSYTAVSSEAELPEGHGVLDVSAPVDAVVVVDGKERARGSATLPVPEGSHNVRVRTSADERGCTVDVHLRRVAHVRF